jgi:hypothetical protein
MRVISMQEWVYGAVFSIILVILASILWRLLVCSLKIDALTELSRDLLASSASLDETSIVETVLEAVQDSLGSIEMPSAQDHLIGGVAQMAQMWMMKKMGFDPGQMMQTQPVLDDHETI